MSNTLKPAPVYELMTDAERMVSAYLKELNIWWQYEQAVYLVDEKYRPRVWTPDFYIPDLGFYVEAVGNLDNPSYEYRREIFRINRIHIIFICPFQPNWKEELVSGITRIHKLRSEVISELEKRAEAV